MTLMMPKPTQLPLPQGRIVCPQTVFRAEHTVELLSDGTTATHYAMPGITVPCEGSGVKP